MVIRNMNSIIKLQDKIKKLPALQESVESQERLTEIRAYLEYLLGTMKGVLATQTKIVADNIMGDEFGNLRKQIKVDSLRRIEKKIENIGSIDQGINNFDDDEIDEDIGAYVESLTQVWALWIEESFGSFLTLHRAIKNIEKLQSVGEHLHETVKLANKLANELPNDSEDIARLIESQTRAIQGLKEAGINEEVENFLDTVVQKKTVGLDKITPKVTDWLKEHNATSAFVVTLPSFINDQ
jgi:hypothetical protein